MILCSMLHPEERNQVVEEINEVLGKIMFNLVQCLLETNIGYYILVSNKHCTYCNIIALISQILETKSV